MKRLSLVTLAATTMLAGCNLAPDYARPQGAVPAELPQGGIYPAADTDAPDITRIGWREFFVDPRLRDVIQLGLDNNRDLRVAAANVLQARAQLRVRRADQLPTISADGSATFTNSAGLGGGAAAPGAVSGGSQDLEIYNVGAGFSAFEIDLFGRLANQSRAAQEQLLAAEWAQRSTRISLIAQIAEAWLVLAADREQLEIARATLQTYADSLHLTREQFRIGVASELEAKQVEASYQAALSDIARLETTIAQDRNALNLLAGTTVPDALLPEGLDQGPFTRDALPASLSSDVLLRRPDVLQAEHLLIAENANIGAARAAFFPTISLTATLGTVSTALSGLFGDDSFTYSVAPGVALPIFDGGRRGGNVAYAEASQQAAVATYEKTIQTAFREVADALAQRGRIDEQVSAQAARVDAAQTAARLSDARYRAGVASFLASLDSQRATYAARQQLISTRLLRATNLVELYRALGGGLADVTPPTGETRPAEEAPQP
ncbi:efflux transporter outer membrane subunit [Stakelama tenebrarum]|uniref:Efflux transporter outer membrane subunit n=1 Tax=Stakelama tenebrarum TaxID=2711215 RepID=A0A6G6Y4K8_9SPHN|nr:efflux transporter outer membrane subunit [Sphingosinithalassobacter tenebrarum]QIG79862.1 efflux transporter outer membrane subunit [Sphingosinithalassobacter tenebrarum]